MRYGLIPCYFLVMFASIYFLVGSHELTPITNNVAATTEKPFVIIIPSYNNSQWVEKNLSSIFRQKYENYRIIYINDCSTDDTLEKVYQLVEKYNQKNRTTIIDNKDNMGVAYNIDQAINSCKSHEIIVLVDGDDWLKEDNVTVFSTINNIYVDSSVWLTYGSYEHYPQRTRGICKQLPAWVLKENSFRIQPWVTSHLRTFYAWLYKQIDKKDLMFNGDYFKVTADQAIMLPMLELAADNHIHYIDDILYVYNVQNPLNDFKVRLREQLMMERYIRAKSSYQPLQNPVVVA